MPMAIFSGYFRTGSDRLKRAAMQGNTQSGVISLDCRKTIFDTQFKRWR